MGELNLKAQTFPGAVGTSLSVIWMTYGGWINIVPPDLDQTRELALTAALGIVFAALANIVRALLPKRTAGSLADLTVEEVEKALKDYAAIEDKTVDPERREPR